MRKIISVVFLCFVLIASAEAQDINKVFKNMPRDIIYGLNPELNEHLLANPTDSTVFVATAIYENIKRKALNADFIELQTSEAGTTQIRLLPLINESKIICVVQTVCGTICDSKIAFYTDKWEPIDGSALFPKKDVNWFIKSDVDKSTETYEYSIALLHMSPMKFVLSKDEAAIQVEFDTKSFLSIEDAKVIEPLLTNEVKELNWNKTKFE